MNGLAIDPNPHETGLVYICNGEVDAYMTLDSRVGEKPGGDPALVMAWMLFDEIAVAPALSWVAVEGIYVGPNAAVALSLARIMGCIQLAAARRGVRYYELSTLEIDRGLGLTYSRGKRKLATATFARLNGYPDMDEHQADAYAVARAALGKMKVEGWEAQG